MLRVITYVMPVIKKTSSDHEDLQLFTVSQAHFTGYVNIAGIYVISLFINSLCRFRSVNFAKLSSRFNNFVDV